MRKTKEKKKKKNSWLLSLIKNSYIKLTAAAAFLVLISTLVINWHGVLKIFDSYKTEIEYSEQDKFSILILPFNQYCPTDDGKLDVGKVLFDRFETLKREKKLDINVSYAVDKDIPNNLKIEDYLSYMKDNKYDMVIFGNAQSIECNSRQENQVCVKYIFDNKSFGNSIPSESQNLSNTLYPVEINDLLSGRLQKDIDVIVFNALGAIEQYRGNNSRAMSHYEFIHDSLDVFDPVVFSELIALKLRFEEFAAADNLVSQFKSKIDSNDIDLLLSYYSMRIMVFSYSEQLNRLNSVIDSFNNTFIGIGINENKINLVSLHRIGEYLIPVLPETAIRYLDFAIQMAEKLSLSQELAKAYHDKSRALYYVDRYKESMVLAELAIELYDQSILENEWLIIRALEVKAYCLINLSDYTKADSVIRQIIRKARSIGVNWEVANILLKIAAEFQSKNSFEKVVTYTSIGEKYCQYMKSNHGKKICATACLSAKGQAYFKIGEYKRAIKALKKAIELGEGIGLEGPEDCAVVISPYIRLIEGLDKKSDRSLISSTLKRLDEIRIDCFEEGK